MNSNSMIPLLKFDYMDNNWIIYHISHMNHIRKINSERSEMFIFQNTGNEEFIKLILLLFRFAQRLCDTQKWEGMVTRLS